MDFSFSRQPKGGAAFQGLLHGVLHVGVGLVASADATSGTDAGTRVALVLVDVARASFDDLLAKAAIGGGVVLVLGVLLTVGESVRRGRGPTAGP